MAALTNRACKFRVTLLALAKGTEGRGGGSLQSLHGCSNVDVNDDVL